MEVLAAFLLFFRRSATFDVGLIFGFIDNVAVVNGFYDVGELITSTFIVLLASFLFISVRCRHAIFENWSTLSYKVNRGAIADRMIGYSPLLVKDDKKNNRLNQVNTKDSDKLAKQKKNRDLGVTRWEVGGMAGDRRYFFYTADTVKKVLYLQNKNKNHDDETQVLHYTRPTSNRFILTGVNEFRDSIYVVPDRVDKKYPLEEGRQTTTKAF